MATFSQRPRNMLNTWHVSVGDLVLTWLHLLYSKYYNKIPSQRGIFNWRERENIWYCWHSSIARQSSQLDWGLPLVMMMTGVRCCGNDWHQWADPLLGSLTSVTSHCGRGADGVSYSRTVELETSQQEIDLEHSHSHFHCLRSNNSWCW